MINKIPRESRAYYLPLVIVGTVLLPLALAFAGNLYKWIDENGKTHYGDRIPPSELKLEHSEINKDGVVIKTINAVMSEEEREQARRTRELEAKEREKARRRAIRDKNLIETYRSSDEIILARDEYISRLDNLIKIASSKIERLVFDRLELTSHAANNERVGVVPKDIQAQIKNIDQQIARQQEYIAVKVKEKEDINALFEEDLRRYRQLAEKQ